MPIKNTIFGRRNTEKHYHGKIQQKVYTFFNNREMRAVWDEEQSKWWFSATDVVRAINDEDDYTKSRNYWKYLKGKLMKAGIEVVSATNQFKFEAPDGKMRTADVLDGRQRTLYPHLAGPHFQETIEIACRLESDR